MSSEHFYFWLIGLRDISRAEKYLQCTEKATAQAIIKIGDALTHYQKAVTSLKVSLSGIDIFSTEQDSKLFCLFLLKRGLP